MDPTKQEKLGAAVKITRSAQSLSGATGVAASVSAVLLLYYGACQFFSTFNVCNAILLFLNQADRGVMFILCNAILLVVAIDSGSAGGVTLCSGLCGEFRSRGGRETGAPHAERDAVIAAAEDNAQGETGRTEGTACREVALAGVGEIEEEEEKEDYGNVCAEDMNKKFDEFIEKFKRERRLEALQLITA